MPAKISITAERQVRTVVVGADDDGRRIDNYLASLLKNVPKRLVYKILRRGEVRVNGGRVKPDYRLAVADKVRIPPLHIEVNPDAAIPAQWCRCIEAAILFESEDFLVVNKPAGLPSHGGTGLRYGVVEIARQIRPYAPSIDLAHRLDRDTSGCLVLSKNTPALREFHRQLRARTVGKHYVSLLRGTVPATLGAISAALTVARDGGGERRARVCADGKTATTLIESCRHAGPHSLATFRLETGRMHQIRAHAKHIGHPIAGDRRYGNREFNRAMKIIGLNRLFLHAADIEFSSAGKVAISAPLPEDLRDVLAALDA